MKNICNANVLQMKWKYIYLKWCDVSEGTDKKDYNIWFIFHRNQL